MAPSIRMIFTRDYKLTARSPCGADDRSMRYWSKEASSLLQKYPNAHAVIIVNRSNSSQVRYYPDSDCIMIAPSTPGRWGKSRIVRRGSKV